MLYELYKLAPCPRRPPYSNKTRTMKAISLNLIQGVTSLLLFASLLQIGRAHTMADLYRRNTTDLAPPLTSCPAGCPTYSSTIPCNPGSSYTSTTATNGCPDPYVCVKSASTTLVLTLCWTSSVTTSFTVPCGQLTTTTTCPPTSCISTVPTTTIGYSGTKPYTYTIQTCVRPTPPTPTTPPPQALWGQCGGIGWTGPTTCQAGSRCQSWNDWYSE